MLDKAKTEPLIEKKTLILTFPYEVHRTVQKQLDLPEIVTLDTQYTDQVTLTCTLPADQVPEVTQQLEDATCGHIGITVA